MPVSSSPSSPVTLLRGDGESGGGDVRHVRVRNAANHGHGDAQLGIQRHAEPEGIMADPESGAAAFWERGHEGVEGGREGRGVAGEGGGGEVVSMDLGSWSALSLDADLDPGSWVGLSFCSC